MSLNETDINVIGIIGGGQLARMLALAGIPLGFKFVFLDTYAECPASALGKLIVGQYDDLEKLHQLADQADVLSFDFENVPATAINSIAQKVPFHPSPAALATAQDRLSEKTLFRALGIATPEFHNLEKTADLASAKEFTYPAILKTRRLGYDGKGQVRIRDFSELNEAWNELGRVDCLLEGFVDFDLEVSQVATRDQHGNIAFYPLTHNRHENGILVESIAPYSNAILQEKAQDCTRKVLKHFDYVGTLAIEYFVAGDNLIVNEMAPRVHNSGHWTIEGAVTSQFENHIRAITGLPLGAADAVGQVRMQNCIGEMPARSKSLTDKNAHYHDYGKSARPGRKVGHITYVKHS